MSLINSNSGNWTCFLGFSSSFVSSELTVTVTEILVCLLMLQYPEKHIRQISQKPATFQCYEPNPKMHQVKFLLCGSDQRKWAELYLSLRTDYTATPSHSGLTLQLSGSAGRQEVSWNLQTGGVTDKGSDRQMLRTSRRKASEREERRGKGDTKEWPVGMNESSEDVSGSCLRINPTVSRKQSTNTSRPAAELPVLRQLKGNFIKMQMWPIYQGAKAQIEIWDVCVCVFCAYI